MVVVEAVALVGDFDLARPEQGGEDQPQHVTLPTVGRAAESLLQRLAHAAVFVAVAVFALQVVEHFLGDIGVRVDDVLGAILDDQPQPVIADVEDVGQGLEVSRLEDLFGLVALQRSRTHLQLRVQVGHDLAEELLQDFAQALAQGQTRPSGRPGTCRCHAPSPRSACPAGGFRSRSWSSSRPEGRSPRRG